MPRRFAPALALHSLTPLYDRLVDLLGFGRAFVLRAAGALPVRDGQRLLDIGSGTGSLLAELAARYPHARLAGIDADRRMLLQSTDKLGAGSKTLLAQALAQALPFPNETFDAAVSTLIFHHLPTHVKREALSEIYRVLRPGGAFLLADFGRPQTLTQAVLLRAGSVFDGVENMRVNLRGGLPSLLREAGFSVTETAPRYRAVQFLLARK